MQNVLLENGVSLLSEQIFPGLFVYKNVFKKDLDIINRLESKLSSKSSLYNWHTATVSHEKKVLDYRNCYDFKIKPMNIKGDLDWDYLEKIWKDCYIAQKPYIEDYSYRFQIRMQYWEAFNFIKYEPGQHFQEHSDHGDTYVSTLSSVGYLNDDYEGGELSFPKLNITIKPEAGDLYLFPSSYLFSHIAKPVLSGVKYSIVTMLDYHGAAHNSDYDKIEKKYYGKSNINL